MKWYLVELRIFLYLTITELFNQKRDKIAIIKSIYKEKILC